MTSVCPTDVREFLHCRRLRLLIADREFTEESALAGRLDNSVFKFCTFSEFSVSGKPVDAIFFNCAFVKIDFYLTFFNICLFVDVCFENCTFRGVGFAECRFLNCKFVNCRFSEDDLGGKTTFDQSQWFACKVENCVGLPWPEMERL